MQTSQLHVLHFDDFYNAHIPEIFQEIYLQKLYFPYISNKKDAVFLDIGLNIGLWSLYAFPYAKQIYALEPASEICKIAQKNIDDNGISNVKIFQKALGATDGEMTLYHSSNKTMYSMNPAVNDNQEKEQVNVMSFDTLIKENKIEHIDFMKLDVEGSEDKILASDGFRNNANMIDAFIYEWHTWTLANPNTINAGLKELGFNTKQLPSNATIFLAQKV